MSTRTSPDSFATRIRFLTRSELITVAFVCASLVASCSSPQQVTQQRQLVMEKFVVGVTKHLLDRNPQTIKESMNVLTRNELTQATVEKMQNQHLIPETDISILKIIDEANRTQTTNEVLVGKVRPLGPITSNEVPFQVIGKEIINAHGIRHDSHIFEFTITCQLTPDMGDFPRVTDITDDTRHAKSSQRMPETKAAPRHRHRFR